MKRRKMENDIGDVMDYIGDDDIEFIRSLKEMEFKMVLGEIHDHGWFAALKLMAIIRTAIERGFVLTSKEEKH